VKKKRRFEVAPLTEALKQAAAAEGTTEDRAEKEACGAVLDGSGKPRSLSTKLEHGAKKMNSKRVLVVDDEQCIADTLAAILQKSGYQATAVYDAESAMQECELAIPELIITDVVMPGTGGVELAIQVREMYPECRILLFSGQAATADILARARTQGHQFDLLAKPIHPTDLLAKIAG
jgi:CheY-like chemotaxis protein